MFLLILDFLISTCTIFILAPPLAGAWIEIDYLCAIVYGVYVAPLAGAWIEINIYLVSRSTKQVAPLAGAWIEIQNWIDD